MLPLALILEQLRRMRSGIIGAIALLIVLCQIQTFQYRYYQIHWSDMTKEKILGGVFKG